MNEKNIGTANMLMEQVDKIFRHSNQGSIKTRFRYREATYRFCEFLSSEYKLVKFKNASCKHIYAYTEHLAKEGKSEKFVLTELSGIRYFHDFSGSRNRLPDNKKIRADLLNKSIELKQKTTGKINRAWDATEIQTALNCAGSRGNMDIYYSIKLSASFGLRIEETVKCRVGHVKDALESGKLYVKGKGGLIRYVPIETTSQRELLKDLVAFAKSQGRNNNDDFILIASGNTKSEKQRIQSFVYRYQKQIAGSNRLLVPATISKAKPLSEKLNFHGLRYYYAQSQFEKFKMLGYNDRDARLKVSELLGHHRERITNTYLSDFTK